MPERPVPMCPGCAKPLTLVTLATRTPGYYTWDKYTWDGKAYAYEGLYVEAKPHRERTVLRCSDCHMRVGRSAASFIRKRGVV